MNLETMSHDQAVSSHAPERYLLGELDGAERDAFEGHYFDCTACFDDIKKGSQFLSYSREVMDPEPEKGRFAALLGDLRRPAPAFVSAALLCAVGLGAYQQIQIADARRPRVEASFVFHGASRGADVKALNVSRRAGLGLKIEFTPSAEYKSYQAEILSANGTVVYSKPLAGANVEDGVTLALPADSLTPGKYSVVVEGQTTAGNEEKIAGGAFDLQFTD